MRNAYPHPDDHGDDRPTRQGITCASCGRFSVHAIAGVFANPQTGSTRRFCSPACRQAAHRRRRAGAPEDLDRQHHGGRSRNLAAQTTQEPPIP